MMYLSRLTLKRTPSAQALQALLQPDDESRRLDAHHRLIWTAFAGDPDAKRDFLWRDEGDGRFLILSARKPAAADLFETPEIKEFAPRLESGDRLSFLLRANATRTVKTSRVTAKGKREREHRDLVMDLLKPVPRGERAEARMTLAADAGRIWLKSVGARAGFSLTASAARAYRVVEPPGRGARAPRFGVLDLEGRLTVEDPAVFVTRLSAGFGRAKAFGCGLMLIRRA